MTQYGFVAATVDTFIKQLPTECTELDSTASIATRDPASDAFDGFRRALRLLYQGLEQRDETALLVFGLCRNNLIRLSEEIKRIIRPDRLRNFLSEQLLLHPHRRMPVGAYMLALSRAASNQTLQLDEIFQCASLHFSNWQEAIYDANNIFIDPDLLPTETFEAALVQVSSRDESEGDSCIVCDLPFTFPRPGASDQSTASARSAIRTPCNHHFCHECLQHWRLEASGGKFSCPMCRSCLACGTANCTFHVVPYEPARPYPLRDFLDAHFKNAKGRQAPFYGIDAAAMRQIRESTRRLRVQYGYYHLRHESSETSQGEKENCECRMSNVAMDIDLAITQILNHSLGMVGGRSTGNGSGAPKEVGSRTSSPQNLEETR